MIPIPLESLSILCAAGANAAVGLYVVLCQKDSVTNRSFLLFATGAALWSGGIAFLPAAPAWPIEKVIFFGGTLMTLGFYLLSCVMPHRDTLSRAELWGLVPFAPLILGTLSGWFVVGIMPRDGHTAAVFGPYFLVYAVVTSIYFFWSLGRLMIKVKRAQGREQLALYYFFVGAFIFITSSLIFDLLLPAVGIATFNFLGPLSLFGFVALTAYAIGRHELMDIKIIIRRGLLYGFLLAVVGGMYLVLVGAMGFFFGTTAYTLFLSAVLTALGVAFAAPHITRARLYQEAQRHAAELEQKVEERTKELQEAQEGQRQMMLDVSHGLQTPLAVFQTKLEQLKQAMPEDKGVRHFETSLADLSNFIHSLLRLARLEHNQEEIALVPMSLTSLLEEIVEEVKIIATEQDIFIRQAIAANIEVNGDAKKFREVLMNLASNSIKYMRPQDHKEILFLLEDMGGAAVLSVSDTGIGISNEDLPHIFERFYRVRHSIGKINGSGLGLAISKQIVEQHGGTLVAHSAPGEGTTMTITLPLCAPSRSRTCASEAP